MNSSEYKWKLAENGTDMIVSRRCVMCAAVPLSPSALARTPSLTSGGLLVRERQSGKPREADRAVDAGHAHPARRGACRGLPGPGRCDVLPSPLVQALQHLVASVGTRFAADPYQLPPPFPSGEDLRSAPGYPACFSVRDVVSDVFPDARRWAEEGMV